MSTVLEELFNGNFMPHGHCLLWRPDLLLIHIIPDTIIGLSYYIIPFALVYLTKRRDDLVFDWIFVMFSVFIFACGTTHFMEIVNIWYGYYYLEGIIKVFTAIASIATAILIWPLIPRILAIPSNAMLAATNGELKATKIALETINNELEQRIKARTQELQESNDELNNFAYAASHDLREPLRGISTYVSFLLEDHGDKIGDDGRQKLHSLGSLTHRLDNLISSLLEYSRLNRISLAKQEVDLDEALNVALEPLQITLQEQAVTIIRVNPLPRVYCDYVRIQQVLYNLIINAIHYNDKPEKRIEIGVMDASMYTRDIDLHLASQASDSVVIYVRDNGIGIREDHLELAFRIFKRLHGRQKFPEGSGIGLTLSKRIIEKHGGHIWVESRYGEGTTFYFSLPLNSPRNP